MQESAGAEFITEMSNPSIQPANAARSQLAPAGNPMAATPFELGVIIASAEQILKSGMPLQAYQVASDGLLRNSQNVRLKQLQALALARCGATEGALQILQDLVRSGAKDAETSGIMARTHKDLWLKHQGTETGDKHLRDAQALYQWGYQNARAANDFGGAIYTGINSASMLFFMGDCVQARARARQVKELCDRIATPDYWTLASEAEAELIAGDFQSAAQIYGSAAETWQVPADISTTRRQARLLLAAMGRDPNSLDAALAVPTVVAVRNSLDPELFAEDRERLHEQIGESVSRLRPSLVYLMIERAEDAAVAQAFLNAGHKLDVVVASWQLCSSNDSEVRNILSNCADVTIVGRNRSAMSNVLLRYAELMRDGLAMLRAQSLDTASSILALEMHDGSVQLVPAQLTPVSLINFEAAIANDMPREYLRATLAARIIEFRELTDDRLPIFIQRFLGAIANVQSRASLAPVSSSAFGEDLFFAFRSPRDAGRFALLLAENIRSTDWAALGLPAGLGLQMALNAGPIFEIGDPVTCGRRCMGSHLAESSDLRQITPPGLISATQSFAAVAAAQQIIDFCCVPAGMAPMPPTYENQPVYSVIEAG